MATLRERQITALSSLLSLNSPSSSSSSSLTPSSSNQLPTWKVLVMDKIAQDVLATSLRVQDLRDSGVTLHMFVSSSLSLIHPTWSISLPANLTHWCRQLHSERPALSDVPAIYFVSPSSVNIQRIAQDLKKGLYSSTYVNFTSALSRTLLEEFAETVAKDGTVEGVEQVRFHVSHFTTSSLRGFRIERNLVDRRSMINISISFVSHPHSSLSHPPSQLLL